jgi:hypothetical protein
MLCIATGVGAHNVMSAVIGDFCEHNAKAFFALQLGRKITDVDDRIWQQVYQVFDAAIRVGRETACNT